MGGEVSCDVALSLLTFDWMRSTGGKRNQLQMPDRLDKAAIDAQTFVVD